MVEFDYRQKIAKAVSHELLLIKCYTVVEVKVAIFSLIQF